MRWLCYYPVKVWHSIIVVFPWSQRSPRDANQDGKRVASCCGMLSLSAEFDVIGYGCTSGATIIGPDRVAATVRKVRPAAKVTDPITAVMAACDAMKVSRLGFVTPYVEQVSAAMRALLEGKGYKIAGFGSFEALTIGWWPASRPSPCCKPSLPWMPWQTVMLSSFHAPTCELLASLKRRKGELASP